MDFNTIKVPNFGLALYMLSIRAPEPPYPAIETFIFPLSPQRVRKSFTSMSVPYDTFGTPAQAGVNRDVDNYGAAPFTYEIEGTTGWDLHMTDGFSVPGQLAIQNLQQMFYDYASYNSEQMLNNDPNTYIMEFADFFNGEFYQVEPIGQQDIRASDRAPLLQYFRLRLAVIQPLDAPLLIALTDAIDIILAMSATTATVGTIALASTVLGLY